MLRSSLANNSTILARLTAHRNALRALLHSGMARGHRGNPAASLHVDEVYGIPVLLSGLGPLVLSKTECSMISQHHKEIISNLQRLLPLTPRSVIYFLAGSLPGEALLHLRQLSIFGMITRLPASNVSHQVSTNLLKETPVSKKTWIFQISEICEQYCLPHPLQLLQSPLPKMPFKKLVKKRVTDYWEQLLRAEAADPRYSSLLFFKPSFMSLSSPHPLWTTAGSSPAQVSMATVQAQMLSGRYRSESLCRHWSKNKNGFCLLPSCEELVEDIPHILSSCSGLAPIREKLVRFTHEYCTNSAPVLADLVTSICKPENENFIQFLLDCSTLPEVISAAQRFGDGVLHHLFKISRTWVYSLHRTRMKKLGRWNFV